MNERCGKHDKEYELFCMACKGTSEPMCSFCLCEHNEVKHVKGNIPIATVIKEKAKKLQDEIINTDKPLELFKLHIKTVEDELKKVQDLKAQLDLKIAHYHHLIAAKTRAALQEHSTAMQCCERALTTIHGFKRLTLENALHAEQIVTQTEAMLINREYWKAFKHIETINLLNTHNDSTIRDRILALQQSITNFQIRVQATSLQIVEPQPAKEGPASVTRKDQAQGKKAATLYTDTSIAYYKKLLKTVLNIYQSEEWYGKVNEACHKLLEPTTTHLALTTYMIKDAGINALTIALRCTRNILYLDIGITNFGSEGAEALGTALIGHPSLKAISLGAPFICSLNTTYTPDKPPRHEHASHDDKTPYYFTCNVPGYSQGRASFLHSCYFNYNGWHDASYCTKPYWNQLEITGIQAIAEGLKNNLVLERLFLCFTDVDDAGVAELVTATNVNMALQELCLGGNEKVTDKTGAKYGFRSSLQVHYT